MKLRARQQARFSALYIAGAIVVLVLLQSWLLAPQAQEIPLSRLIEWVREGRVARVSFGEREVRGVLKEPITDAPTPTPQWLTRFTGWTPGVLFVAVRIPGADDATLLRELEAHKVEFSGRIESTLVRDLIFGWLLPIGVMAGIWIFLMRRMGGGPTQALTFGRSKVKIYDRKELKTTFADVAGVDEAKAELVEVVDFLRNPQKYQRLGGRIPKGVLIVGPPGSGKTLLARAVAGRPTCRSSSCPGPSSSRCSSASARRACAISSSRPRRRRPASSSSTSWTPSARVAPEQPASWAGTTSANRPSTSCWSRWTASTPRRA